MSLTSELILLVVFLFLSGFFSGAEIALVSLSKHKVQEMLAKKLRGASSVEKLKNDPQRMLSTILIGNNVVNVGASALATAVAIELFDSFALGIATGVMTLLILVFGEITPKTIAQHNAAGFARTVAPTILMLSVIFAPILHLLNAFLNRILSLIGIQPMEQSVSEDEIKSMVQVAEEEGTIKKSEQKMINSIFEFDDINVSEIATSRRDVVSVSPKATIADAVKLMNRFSRIPVYDKEKDQIVGILYLKQLIGKLARSKSTPVTKVMKPAYFVPESKKISNLLKQFQKRKELMAIVVDEHGVFTGLVTLEDILEEIVGEIVDETDPISRDIKKINGKKWEVRGKTEIDVINEEFKLKLKGEDYDTFSGFILNHTGTIPKLNEVIKYKKYTFKIAGIDGQRITKVIVAKK